MHLIRHLHRQNTLKKGVALTIGNFDGVHLGHQSILKHLTAYAKQHDLTTVVAIFEPQPKEFFQGQHAPLRISTLTDKLALFEQAGIHQVVLLPFSKPFASLSPQEFIDQYLLHHLNTRYLLVGDDFRFGFGRTGDVATLQSVAVSKQFKVETVEMILTDQKRISSSSIRENILAANFPEANRLLGREFMISGRVVHGNALGRTLGFPTANFWLKRQSFPLEGIFAAQVHGLSDKPLPGAAYIGYRPVIKGKVPILEVNILDFDQDIYGKRLSVELLSKLRNDKPIDGLDALKQQIASDVEAIRDYFQAL